MMTGFLAYPLRNIQVGGNHSLIALRGVTTNSSPTPLNYWGYMMTNIKQTGLTMDDFSRYVRLPISTLYQQKISEVRNNNTPAIQIPYMDISGQKVQTQLRLSNDSSNKWKWVDYSRPLFYGLNRIPKGRKISKLFIVEGATDVLAAQYVGLHAVGVAGANNFKPEMMKDIPLKNIDKIYVLNEQDDGGKTFMGAFHEYVTSLNYMDKAKFKYFDLGEGLKDLLDLWKSFNPEQLPKEFLSAINAITETAEPIINWEETLFEETAPDVAPATEEISDTPERLSENSEEISQPNPTYRPPVKIETAKEPPPLHKIFNEHLLGDIVQRIAPTTESNEHGLMAHILGIAGHTVGKAPFVQLGGSTIIRANLFIQVIGRTSGRKGTARDATFDFIDKVGVLGFLNNVMAGFSSGEFLVQTLGYDTVTDEDTGEVTEIRATKVKLNIDEEFERLLIAKNREGSIIRPMLQLAFDGKRIEKNSLQSQIYAEDYHFSYIGHITPDNLAHYINSDKLGTTGGFFNRFLFIETWKDKQISTPMTVDWGSTLADFENQLVWARQQQQVYLSSQAQEFYEGLKKKQEPSGYNARKETTIQKLTSRYSTHLIKLALIFYLFDTERPTEVSATHLEQSARVLEISQQTISRLLKTVTGDNATDELYQKIKNFGGVVTGRELYNDISGKDKATQERNLELLADMEGHFVEVTTTSTRTKPITTWKIL